MDDERKDKNSDAYSRDRIKANVEDSSTLNHFYRKDELDGGYRASSESPVKEVKKTVVLRKFFFIF
jgi:hypothetical protein